jgi:Right handed beta helix region
MRAGLLTVALVTSAAWADVVNVSTEPQLRAAIAAATPGTVIHLAPGRYVVATSLRTASAGTSAAPIVLTSDDVMTARLDVDDLEGLVINDAWWVVEKVWLNGVCAGGCNDSAGLHLKATADHFVGRQLRITNFGENIKGDRTPTTEPSDCTILDSEISNEAPEMSGGGTGIDVVGGKRWRIAGNYVHDYARDGVHYGIFLKGGTSDGVIERNLVIGAKTLAHGSGAEVGISFGGGGTGPQFCATGNAGASFCTCEDFNGVARNNLVVDVNDSALHSKVACGSQFLHNTVVGSSPGLQVQIVSTGAAVEAHNNVFSGGISGTAIASNNLLNATVTQLYANVAALDFSEGPSPGPIKDKGPVLAKVSDDYFGAPRSAPDWGAIEFPAAGKVWPWGVVVSDAGMPDAGAPDGGMSVDAGGTADAGSSDGGAGTSVAGSCGCSQTSFGLQGLVVLGLMVLSRRRGDLQ